MIGIRLLGGIMYLYNFRAGKDKSGNVLATEDIDRDTNAFLKDFGFLPFYVDPENKNEKPFEGVYAQKIYVQYENPSHPVTAFKVITPLGNHLEWSDPKSGLKHFKCACYLGLLGLPAPDTLDEKSKDMIRLLKDLKDNKYSSRLEEHVTFEDASFAEQYKKLLPSKNFFALRVGREHDGHILKTATLDNELNSFLHKLGFAKWYWDPANKTSDMVTKVQIQYQVVGGGVSAFRVYIIEGNKLDYKNGKGNRFKAAIYIGFPNLDHLEGFDKKGMFDKQPEEVRDVVKSLIARNDFMDVFIYLKSKYNPDLEDVVKKNFINRILKNKNH